MFGIIRICPPDYSSKTAKPDNNQITSFSVFNFWRVQIACESALALDGCLAWIRTMTKWSRVLCAAGIGYTGRALRRNDPRRLKGQAPFLARKG